MDIANKVRRAAEPFSISAAAVKEQTAGSIFLLPPALRVLPRSDEEQGNVWVKGDDLVDILLIAGTSASEETVESAIQQLRNFLPGIISGKFCLQEVLAINEFHEVRGGSGPSQSASKVAKKPIANPLTASVEFKANETRRHRIAHSTWKLPFRETALPVSRAAILEEFKRLDIRAEGRIHLLDLHTALKLREVHETEQNIQLWFRSHDRGAKGYIDISDYEAIYKAADKPDGGADKRTALMKKAFAMYDVDGDGRITVEDLRAAFTASGKPFTPADLSAFVMERDTSGSGAVSFNDFAKHFRTVI